MTVIDSSSWVEALRDGGRPEIRQRVAEQVQSGRARFVPMVRLELWNGARGDSEKRSIRHLEEVVPTLEVTAEVWNEAFELARRAREAGLTVPAADIVIAACARHHGAAVEAADGHFADLAKL